MNKKRNVHYSYEALIWVTFLGIMFYSSTYLFATKYIIEKGLSYYLLEKASVVPTSPVELYFLSTATFAVLVFIICFRREMQGTVWNYAWIVIELVVMVILFLEMRASYNGMIFLVFADVFFSTKDLYSLKRKFYWVLFIGFVSVCLVLSNYNLVAMFFHLPSIEVYINFLPERINLEMNLCNNLIDIFSLIVFIITLLTYIIYSTNEKRNIEEELRMADKVNADLKSYVTLAEENAELRERKRISREIHDTLGHALTGIAAGIDAVMVLIDIDRDGAKKQLENISRVVREGIIDVRNSLNKLRPEALKEGTLQGSLEKMIQNYTDVSKINVKLCYQWGDADFEKTTEDVIFRTIEESITNSLRHGHAKNVSIILTQDEDNYHVVIQDDGTGASEFKYGFGLTQMSERIAIIGGKVSYDGKDGFKTMIEFKRRDENG